MKIRTGFVSNSSSSSFVMVGVEMLKGETAAGTPLDIYEDSYGPSYIGIRYNTDCIGTLDFDTFVKAVLTVKLYIKDDRKLQVIYGEVE